MLILVTYETVLMDLAMAFRARAAKELGLALGYIAIDWDADNLTSPTLRLEGEPPEGSSWDGYLEPRVPGWRAKFDSLQAYLRGETRYRLAHVEARRP